MSNLNKALLIGRLTKDPEMRYTPSGTAVTNFSIATNRWSSGPEGERKEFTDYHNIVAYNIGKRNLAEIVAQYTRKGALVFIEGRIQTRSWEGQDGQKRRTTEIIANDVQFLDSRSSGPSDGVPRQKPRQKKASPLRTTRRVTSTRTRSRFRSTPWQLNDPRQERRPHPVRPEARSDSTARSARSASRRSITSTTRRSRGCAALSATGARSSLGA